MGVAGDLLTGAEMAAALGKALGRRVVYRAVPFDVYRSLGSPGADDLGNMFQFEHDFQEVFCGIRDVDGARDLNPALQSFDRWLTVNKGRIPLE